MKKFYLIILPFGLLINALFSQSVDRNIVASAGGNAKLSDIYIDWTLGEPVIETVNNDVVIISEGFHQHTGIIPRLYKIEGNIIGAGIPYDNANVYLYQADNEASFPPSFKNKSLNGIFSFSFIPNDHYLLYAEPGVVDEFLPTYYYHTTERDKAYILDLNANIGGIDLKLVSKFDEVEKVEDLNFADYMVYPTIFTDKIFVRAGNNNPSDYKVSICSIAGGVILVRDIHSDMDQEIDLSKAPIGTYLIKIEGNHSFHSCLILKVK